MSIVRSVCLDDPFAAITWPMCVAIIALEKIRHGLTLDREEQEKLAILIGDIHNLVMMGRRDVLEIAASERLSALSSMRRSDGDGLASDENGLAILEKILTSLIEDLNSPSKISMTPMQLSTIQDSIGHLLEVANRLRRC